MWPFEAMAKVACVGNAGIITAIAMEVSATKISGVIDDDGPASRPGVTEPYYNTYNYSCPLGGVYTSACNNCGEFFAGAIFLLLV